jgi:hypothetical protein
MENAMNTLQQSLEKMRAMRGALKRSMNPPADAFMYAEFAALPLNMFQRVESAGAGRLDAQQRDLGEVPRSLRETVK